MNHIDQFKVWEKKYFNLIGKKFHNYAEFYTAFENKSILDAEIMEWCSWVHIKVYQNTSKESDLKIFNDTNSILLPLLEKLNHQFEEKILKSRQLEKLPSKDFDYFLRKLKTKSSIFLEKNIPLHTEIAILTQKYRQISSQLTINYDNQIMSLAQVTKWAEFSFERKKRKKLTILTYKKRDEISASLNQLFDSLIDKRNQIAFQLNFKNFQEYKFSEQYRYDYTIKNCLEFHQSVKELIVPIINDIYKIRKRKLKVNHLRNYDLTVEIWDKSNLIAYKNKKDWLNKTAQVLNNIDPIFCSCFQEMITANRLDLEPRKNKAPGGFNCSMPQTRIPFIFMNATQTFNDVITLFHELGHAMHNFLSFNLPLTQFKEYPIEMAELASLSLELIASEHWQLFFTNEKDYIKSKIRLLERIILSFPAIAQVDSFQHWVYTHKNHTIKDRNTKWAELYNFYKPAVLDDYPEFTEHLPVSWQKILHIFEVPFYYIEYGIAQLGAIAIWKNYKENPRLTLKKFKRALSLGSSRNLKELYVTAGIQLDFSYSTIENMIPFIKDELFNLYSKLK